MDDVQDSRRTQGARVVAVNVVHELRQGPSRMTAIDKRPVDGRVEVGAVGLVGDTQCDTRIHGGPDQALYAYASEDAEWWSVKLDREIPPGLFGENLTTAEVDVTNAVIGERWRIGTSARGTLVEVRMPRTPCTNLAARMELPGFQRRFSAARRPGAYLKVVDPGTVGAGDPIAVEHRPAHGVTVADASHPRADAMRRLLEGDEDLAEKMRLAAERAVARAS